MIILSILAIVAMIAIYIGSMFLPSMLYSHGFDKARIAKRIIVGHRGGAGIGAENSLTCFKRGIASGADMIEIDIHLTKDGVVVVSHDPTVDRMTNGEGKIEDMTYEEISHLRIESKEGVLTNEHIPTFNQTLELFATERAKGRNVGLLVEIKLPYKDAYKGIERKMLEEIKAHNAEKWITVQSFSDDVIESVYDLDHNIRIEKLMICKLPWLPLIIDGMRIVKFDYKKYHYVSSFNVYYKGLNRSLINDIHAHGKEVKMWTIQGLDAPQLDVDGIITDRPDIWCKERGKR